MSENKKTLFNANFVYFLIICAFVVIRIMAAFKLFSVFGNAADYIFTTVVQIGLLFIVPVFLFSKLDKRKSKDTFTFFGFKKITFTAILITIVMGVLLFILNVYIANFFSALIRVLGYNTPTSSSSGTTNYYFYQFVLNLIFTAVLPGICEEITHRGLLLKANSSLGMKKAILISGILFGLLHLNIEQFFYATLIGLFYGYVAYMTKSIYPTMILHFMNNGLSVFLGYAQAKGWAIGNFFGFIASILSSNIFMAFLFILLFMALLVVSVYWLTKWLITESVKGDIQVAKKEIYNASLKEIYLNEIEKSKFELKNGQGSYNYEKEDELENKIEAIVNNSMTEVFNNEEKVEKPDLTVKFIIVTSFVLLAIITIFTFIWGVL